VHLATLAEALAERLPPVAIGGSAADTPEVEVQRVELDSRAVTPGTLFACVRGAIADGHDHAGDAVSQGAVALLVDHQLDLPVPQLVVPDTRAAIGPLSAAFWGDPSQHLTVLGITGTNGKTTVVHALEDLLESQGRRAASIGTLTGARTTPEAPALQAQLATLRSAGHHMVAVEVSSHALELHRVDGTFFAVAAFTNLSQDHLDFHPTMEAYFEAKARLFTPDRCGHAVVNADDTWGSHLLARLRAVGVPSTPVHPDGLGGVEVTLEHVAFTWRGRRVEVGLGGRYNVANALVVAEVARAAGLDLDEVVAGLRAVQPVPGRLEPVRGGQPFTVLVDYAHTPDGLERALDAVRELTAGRVIVVLGCGGDRDATKRPRMGAVAGRHADDIVVTDDNPRSEDPAAIRQAVLAGVPSATRVREIADRREAIADALAGAREHDVVLIAGKGHESTQTIGDRVIAFDDREVARQLLRARFGGGA
jgi:UDP-N-acetylmuramoyl-L-alanyl-D-glutamate--2,6-diaminopimelate ligase